MRFWPLETKARLVPLKYVCRVNPDALPESTDPELEIEYIDIGNVSFEKGIEARETFRFADAPSRARKPVHNGDVILSTVRTYLKAIAFVQGASDNWIASTGFAVCRPAPGIHAKYLYRALQSSPFIESVVAASTGVSYPAITPSVLSNIEVPIPDLVTQQGIADFLDRETTRIDQLIEKKRALIATLADRRQSLIEDAISFDGPATKLGHHVRILPGYAFPSSEFSADPEDVRLLRGANIAPGRIRWDDVVYWPRSSATDFERFSLKPNDIVLGMDRPWISSGIRIAEIKDHDVPSLLLQRVCKLDPLQTLDKQFMKLLLSSKRFHAYFEPITTGVSVPHISADQVSAFRFAYAPVEIQQDRARLCFQRTSRDEEISAQIEISTDRLGELRSSLITAAVAGQIDVTTWQRYGSTDRRLEVIESEMERDSSTMRVDSRV